MQTENLMIFLSSHKDDMPKVLHYNNVLFELCQPEIYEKFIYKYTIETIEYVKK